jgi:hypothetical protein
MDHLDVRTNLIEKYKDIHHPMQDVSGVELLRFLLNERGELSTTAPHCASHFHN